LEEKRFANPTAMATLGRLVSLRRSGDDGIVYDCIDGMKIGRHKSNQIRVPGVLDEHVMLDVEGKSVRANNLGEWGTTLLNSKPFPDDLSKKVFLAHGDVLQVCLFWLDYYPVHR
jgi:hypothetical protein